MTQNDVDVDALWRKHSLHIDEGTQIMTYPDFERALTEALAGRWKDEDLVDFANMISMEGDGTKWEGQSMARLLAKFKSERGIK